MEVGKMGKFKFRSKVIGVKGFTLIELLVVISIIAVLLSVLMPALNMAKEKARTIVCMNTVKSFSLANEIYATEHNGFSVRGWDWFRDRTFLTSLGQAEEHVEEQINAGYWLLLEDDLLCPDSIVKKRGLKEDPATSWPDSMGTTYAFNCGNLGGEIQELKVRKIRRPSEKIMFMDSSDYMTNGSHDPYTLPDDGINYKLHWDVVGDYWNPFTTPKHHGMVTYRHSEGAVATFWDGHSEWRKKTEYWVPDASGSTDNPTMAKMWDFNR